MGFKKCVSRQDIFCPFRLICFTYLFLTRSLNSVCRVDPANPLSTGTYDPKGFHASSLSRSRVQWFPYFCYFESHVHKEDLPQTFLSEALMVRREQMEQTCSSWLKIQSFMDWLVVPNIFAAAEEKFSLHILGHDPMQCAMGFGTN